MPASPAGDENDKKKQKSWDEAALRGGPPGTPRARRARAPAAGLRMPVIGLEAEFNVFLDGVEIDPRKYWGTPGAFIDAPLLKRERSSFQIPTGGAVYFDRGVIEVVTPVIELAPGLHGARGAEPLGADRLRARRAHEVGGAHRPARPPQGLQHPLQRLLRAARPTSRGPDRNIKTPGPAPGLHPARARGAWWAPTAAPPAWACGPRGNRIEITADFTPDPGLMIATATLVARHRRAR